MRGLLFTFFGMLPLAIYALWLDYSIKRSRRRPAR